MPEDRVRLQPMLVEVAVGAGTSLEGALASNVYFPVEGAASLVTRTSGGQTLEIASAGREAVVGVEHFCGKQMPGVEAVALVDMRLLRLDARQAWHEFSHSPEFSESVLRYAGRYIRQLSQICICSSQHPLKQRLCRWLMTYANALGPGTNIPISHEMLSQRLGVRREAVTRVVKGLRDDGLIYFSKGTLSVLDPAGVSATACDCHHSPEGVA